MEGHNMDEEKQAKEWIEEAEGAVAKRAADPVQKIALDLERSESTNEVAAEYLGEPASIEPEVLI
jgi:hypothetical protein